MFDKVLKFFIDNYKINYTLFFLLFALGVFAYAHIPKEISPAIEPNSVTIRGSYSGASVDTLNKMAVTEIEDEVKNIVGVESVTSVISPGRFTTILELDKRANKADIISSAEDAPYDVVIFQVIWMILSYEELHILEVSCMSQYYLLMFQETS